MKYPVKIDLHMHTIYSDGSDTTEELLGHIREKGIGLFSITDHDAINGALKMRQLFLQEFCEGASCQSSVRSVESADGIRFVNGVELSCRDGNEKFHILGYGYDESHPSILELIDRAHRIRMNKVKKRLDWLKQTFGFGFDQEDIEYLYSLNNPGKPHFAILMAQHGYALSKDDAMERYLNKKEFPEEHIRPEEAIKGILDSGGIPVLAHPFYGDGDQLILGEEIKERIRKLKGCGLQGMECFYSGFTEKLIREALTLAEQYDLLITAGSDYHGSNKTVPLGDTGTDPMKEMPGGLKAFLDRIL